MPQSSLFSSLIISSICLVVSLPSLATGDGDLEVDADSEITIVKTVKTKPLRLNSRCDTALPDDALVKVGGKWVAAECIKGRVTASKTGGKTAGKNATRHLDMTTGNHQ